MPQGEAATAPALSSRSRSHAASRAAGRCPGDRRSSRPRSSQSFRQYREAPVSSVRLLDGRRTGRTAGRRTRRTGTGPAALPVAEAAAQPAATPVAAEPQPAAPAAAEAPAPDLPPAAGEAWSPKPPLSITDTTRRSTSTILVHMLEVKGPIFTSRRTPLPWSVCRATCSRCPDTEPSTARNYSRRSTRS